MLRTVASLDRRGLAVFRLLLGLALVGDLLQRMCDVELHLADAGLYPRALALASPWNSPYVINVWFATGSTWGCRLLLAAAIASASCFALGFRTRLHGWLSWLALLGLHFRNPLVTHAGDVLLRCLLFFANFLPLSEHLSVDAGVALWQRLQRRKCDAAFQQSEKLREAAAEERGYDAVQWAAVAYIVQVACVYIFSSVLKIGVDWRVTGAAAQHALQQKFFRTAFGSLLLRFPSLLSMCTTLVLYWEFWAPFALLLPLSWARVWFVATAALLHVCFGVAMRLGLLVWVPLIALVPLLPGFVWTWVARVHLKSRRAPLVLLVDLESSWLGSRVLFFFHSFLLVDASIEWAHLDGGGGAVGGAPARSPTEWLAVSSLPHGTRLSNADALEELVLATPLPGATVLASVVHRVAIVLGGVLAAVGRIRDDDSPLRYKRPPRAQPVLPGAPARSAAAVPNAALEDLAWLRGLGRVVVASWVVLAMVFVVRHNLSTAGLVGPHGPYWNALGSLCGLHQSWDMFAPNPAQSYWWYRVVARSDAGNPLSLADQGLFQWQAQPLERSLQEPHSLWAHFEGSHRLFKYFETGINTNVAGVRSRFGRFMCAQWNARQLPRIASLELYQHVIPLAPGAEPLDHLLWEDKCSDALASTATASPTPTVAPTPAPSAPVVSRPVPPAPPVVATVFPVLAEPTVAVGATMVVVANNINNAPPAVAAVDTRPRASASVHESIDRSAPWATVLTSVAPPPAAPGAAASRIGAPAASAPAGAQAAGPQMHALALAWAGLDLKKEAPLTAPPAPAAKHGPLTAPPVSEPLAGKWVRGKWVPT